MTNLFDLTGKVAVITGGSRGLGLEMATALAAAGSSVVITARREQWLKSAEEELRSKRFDVLAVTCDVSHPEQVGAAVQATVAKFGRLDILVNNAGISWGEPAETMSVEKWRQVFETNATGTFLMSQAAGNEMMRNSPPEGEAHQRGSIINIASVAGITGVETDVLDAVGYSASKGAVITLTRDLAVKWAKRGIRVNAIAPGFFDTRLSHALLEKTQKKIEKTTPMGRIGKPGELGGVAVFLASAAASYITGQVIAVDGGMTA
ncbi:MAG TPA: glucose 1-dehydrogenase [Vicinamibacterales bacterium]|nr:glucose 1-dehydrogenase [Vicinamibacterales bacterium]